MAFVEGTTRDDLKKGPGHYPGTPLPGTIGNAAIAGHRTTYLHPFWGVDKLKPGDDIIIHDAVAGTFVYKMTQQLIVKPTDLSVVDNTPDAELTLTSCNPKGSAVAAHRDQGQARRRARARRPSIPKPVRPRGGTGQVARDRTGRSRRRTLGPDPSLVPSIVWGIFAALVGLGVVVGLPALAPPAHVDHRRRCRSSSRCSRSTCTWNARCPPATAAGRGVVDRGAGRGSGGRPHRAVRAPHPGVAVALARRMGRRRGVREGRASPAGRRVQVPRRDERGAVAVGRRREPRRGRALVRAITPPRSRSAAATPRDPRVRRDAGGRADGEAGRGRALRRRRSRECDNTHRRAGARCSPRCSTRTGAVEIHPFDDERVIAGAGTAALELIAGGPRPRRGRHADRRRRLVLGNVHRGRAGAASIGGSPRDRARDHRRRPAHGLLRRAPRRSCASTAWNRSRRRGRRRRGDAGGVGADQAADRAERRGGVRGGRGAAPPGHASGSSLGRQRRSRRAPLVRSPRSELS